MRGEWRKNTNESDDSLVVEMGGQVVGVWEGWWWYAAGGWKGEENPPAVVATTVV